MSTESFHRHTRARVDAAIHRAQLVLRSRPAARDAFARLYAAATTRSDLMRTPPAPGGGLVQLDVLHNLARFHGAFVRDPRSWEGASGHPLRVVASLASHVVGRYPTPRFFASVWFGADTPARQERRRWFIAHAGGTRVRSLPVPIALTRKMEHVFLHSPDHLSVEHALRRAEVLGLGGSLELADAIVATRLGRDFTHGESWREVIAWLVQREEALVLGDVAPIIEYVAHARTQPDWVFAGATVATLRADAAAWREAQVPRHPVLAWAPSRWRALVYHTDDARWTLEELVDSEQLAREGRAMQHCVRTYAHLCAFHGSTIWSLRRHADGESTSVLTIEVSRRRGAILQVKGPRNAAPGGFPLELVHAWAAREGIARHS